MRGWSYVFFWYHNFFFLAKALLDSFCGYSSKPLVLFLPQHVLHGTFLAQVGFFHVFNFFFLFRVLASGSGFPWYCSSFPPPNNVTSPTFWLVESHYVLAFIILGPIFVPLPPDWLSGGSGPSHGFFVSGVFFPDIIKTHTNNLEPFFSFFLCCVCLLTTLPSTPRYALSPFFPPPTEVLPTRLLPLASRLG